MVVVMLLTLSLPLSANTAFASTNVSDQTTVQKNQSTGQNLVNNTVQTTKTTNLAAGSASSSSTSVASGSTQSTTTVSTQTSFTSSQINDAASRMMTFIEANKRLPTYVTISNVQVTMPQFLELITNNLLNINNGLTKSVTLQKVANPSATTESITSGNIYKSEYLNIAQSIKTTIDSSGTAPGYVDSTLGKIKYESMIYYFSKILAFQKTNSRLPTYVSFKSWASLTGSTTGSTGNSSTSGSNTSTGNSTIPSSLQQYLVATKNAQSTSATIIALANSITAGLTSDYDKAVAIFNWVRDNITYTSSYYNTKYGALSLINSKIGNCCDHSHLVVALARAAGLPARYQHGNCQFSDGWFGHVWSQIYVNGKWYNADAMSGMNTFGVINNWNYNTYTYYGTYAALPF
jgi:transglutaminase-like putative cysteine protease